MHGTFFGALAVVLVSATAAVADPLPHNWPLPPSDLERRFAREPFVVSAVEGAGEGRTGAFRLTLEFTDGKAVQAKWKPAPDETLDDWNNSPRREIASYLVQRLFLDENDYVVPTAVLRCLPMEMYGPIDPAARPTLDGSRCVLGMLAVWLRDVSAPEPFYDKGLFERDEVYARSLADFNLLTYLIDHRDGKRTNLLRSTDPSGPHSFSVDNGISFESFPWNMEAMKWNEIRVPWIRRQSVERLRGVDRMKLESFGVVAELVRDENGVFQNTSLSANFSTHRGVRHEGPRIQLGLTDGEINRLRGRIETLLEKVDSGELPVR